MKTFAFRTTAVALVATLLVAAGAYAANQSEGTAREPRGAWLQKKLGLSDVQAQQIREIRARDFAAQRQTWQTLRQAQAELRRLALSGVDDATLNAKQAEVQNLLTQVMQARLNTLKEIGPLLTPEQREAYAKLMERGPRWHRHHMQRQPSQS